MQMVMKLRQMACQIDYCRQRCMIDTRRTLSSPSFQMTLSDRDMSAHRVNLNVIQAVPNHLDPSMCTSPFIPDKPITPVNKCSPVLVIMQRTGGILRQRRRICPPRRFSAISSQQRGAFSPAPSFRTGGISADPSGNKSSLWLRFNLQREISRVKRHLTIC